MRAVTVIGIHARRKHVASGGRSRSLAAYLLVPRPKDLAKGWLVVFACALGVLSTGEVRPVLILRALLVAGMVELLVYQARYQWNDVRGFVADQRHPSTTARGRLPGPLSRVRTHVSASCAVAALRLMLTGLLVVALPGLHLGGLMGFAVAGVFGVAIAYEVLRSVSTGRSGVMPAPIGPGVVLLWCTVGAGYVVRGVIGLALAVDLWRRPTLLVAAVVTLWCYGIAFVTSRWVVEATAFAAVRGTRVVWNVRADQAREHLLALVRWVPDHIAGGVTEVASWAPLRQRTALTAPWNVATIAAGGAAAVTGRLLCGPLSVPQSVIVAAVGAAATVIVVLTSRRRLLLLGAALLLAATLMVLHSPRPALAVLPWLLLLSAYQFFTTRTLAKLSAPNVLAPVIGRLTAATVRIIVGPATWTALRYGGERRDEDRPWVIPPQPWV